MRNLLNKICIGPTIYVLSSCYQSPPMLNNVIVDGCYSGANLPNILVKNDFLIIDQSEMRPVSVSLKNGKHWAYIETKPIRLEPINGVLVFRYYQGTSTFWPVTLDENNMVVKIKPLAKLGGNNWYYRVKEQLCSNIEKKKF